MKQMIHLCIVLILGISDLSSQLAHIGLDSVRVSDIRWHDNQLYVGTIDSGVFRFDPADSSWFSMGLKNRWINTVYPPNSYVSEYSLLVGVDWYKRERDSVSIYGYKDGDFEVADSGISRSVLNSVYSIDGSDGLIIAGADPGILRRQSSVWEWVGGGFGYDVKISRNGTIWVVGADMFWTAAIFRSNDNGDTWRGLVEDFSLDPWDSWFIGSIAIDPKNNNRAYVTSGRAIVKTDSAHSNHPEWERLFFCDQELGKIAIDPFDGDHLFAGGEHFQLFESTDAGNSWQPITPIDSGNTIMDIEIPETEQLTLYIATLENGVYQMTFPEAGFRTTRTLGSGWNLVSLPLIPRDPYKPNVFPSAISAAFTFNGQYEIQDTLVPGKAYWVKYNNLTTEYFIGNEITSLEIDVSSGWNTIGALSRPLYARDIVCSSGLEIGQVYKYTGVYTPDTVIRPGLGYWVKAPGQGKIFLGN